MGTPTLVLVTGPAGSGKSTLAHALAAAVGCPAVCRDELKEGMVASTPGFVPAESDQLTMRTYDLFFEVLTLLLRAEVTLVAEAAFMPTLWRRGLEPLSGLASLKIIRCQVPRDLARERQAARLSRANRRAHADAEHLSADQPFAPLALEVPTLEVDTTDGWRPGLQEVVTFCRA